VYPKREVLRRRKLRRARLATTIVPTVTLSSVLTALLENGTVGLIASVPDLFASNPAVQATGALKPTGNADFGIFWDGTRVLQWPITGLNYPGGGSAFGLAMWLRSPLSTTARMIYRIRNVSGGANTDALIVQVTSGEAVTFQANVDASNSRTASTSNSLIVDNQNQFLTVEYDGLQATEANRVVITLGTVKQTLSYSNGSGSATMPTTLLAATGNVLLGCANLGSSLPFTGTWGKNVAITTSKMAGAEMGVWTNDARAALMNQLPQAA
jgi:hypothetical protein